MAEAYDETFYDEFGAPIYPYFAPRRLGATAPANPSLFALDTRDPADCTPEDPLRTIDSPNLIRELNILMQAGLRVEA